MIGEIICESTAEKIEKLTQIFNELDINTSSDLSLPENMKWRQVLYIYNLLVNNEKYGDKRLTPLLEDYIKEPDSAGFDFVKYSYKLDSGEVPVFLIDPSLVPIDENNPKSQEDIYREAEEILAKEVLFHGYSKNGYLGYDRQALNVKNPDFPLV